MLCAWQIVAGVDVVTGPVSQRVTDGPGWPRHCSGDSECRAHIGEIVFWLRRDKKINNCLDTFLQSLSRLKTRVGDLDARTDPSSFEQVLRWLRVLTAFWHIGDKWTMNTKSGGYLKLFSTFLFSINGFLTSRHHCLENYTVQYFD